MVYNHANFHVNEVGRILDFQKFQKVAKIEPNSLPELSTWDFWAEVPETPSIITLHWTSGRKPRKSVLQATTERSPAVPRTTKRSHGSPPSMAHSRDFLSSATDNRVGC